ncbi:hypothetical protein DFH08DRAFT_898575 [Mycena albidolilacea]|uniref:Uncharacterized protein n=1 Tax=Mycena albidolilacea TaxID=1033008 RepID=A0AAD7ECE3_9AGAR|nr:hypothetical protein DFH08DRAFT_898575 [Mycena albidolilacea]
MDYRVAEITETKELRERIFTNRITIATLAFKRRPSVRSAPSLSFTSPTHPPTCPLIHTILLIMCRWRHVRNVFLRCGHAESLPPVEVKCSSTRCKFSPNHPAGCVPPSCTRTCNQYHLFPEQYNPNVDGFCSGCTRAMSSGRRRH